MTIVDQLNLSESLIKTLKNVTQGRLYSKTDDVEFVTSFSFFLHYVNFPKSFVQHVRIFNGNVISPAKAVVYPVDAEDISR